VKAAAALAAFLLAGCGLFTQRAPKIRKGSLVRIHYTLEADGRPIDSTYAREPVEFQAGRGRLIEGLEAQVMGLKEGDEKTVVVAPEQGYGPRDQGAVQRLPLSRFGPRAAGLRPGMSVQGMRRGRLATARILSIDREEATLDFNHPYAGKTLVFKVKVVGVSSAKAARRRW